MKCPRSSFTGGQKKNFVLKKVIPPRNKSNQGERFENACIFIAEPKGFVLVQIRGDKES